MQCNSDLQLKIVLRLMSSCIYNPNDCLFLYNRRLRCSSSISLVSLLAILCLTLLFLLPFLLILSYISYPFLHLTTVSLHIFVQFSKVSRQRTIGSGSLNFKCSVKIITLFSNPLIYYPQSQTVSKTII